MSAFLRTPNTALLDFDEFQEEAQGPNFGFNHFLKETTQQIQEENDYLTNLGKRNDEMKMEFQLDTINLPTQDNTPTIVSPALIEKYHKLTFAQKEALLDKLVAGSEIDTTAAAAAAAAAAAGNGDDATTAAETNLFLKLLYLQQTPLLNNPQFTGPRDAEKLLKLGRKLEKLAGETTTAAEMATDKSTITLRDVSIIILSASSALVVGYVAASIATAAAATAAAATAATAAATGTVAATTAAATTVSIFSAVPRTMMVKVFTIVYSARKGDNIKESLEIMLKTGARETLTFGTSMVVGEGSRITATFISKLAATPSPVVNQLLGYAASSRAIMFMANDGMRVLMENIKFIQPTEREKAWVANQERRQKRMKEEQDFIDLCNEIQYGYKRPLKIMQEAYTTFKIKLDHKTKNHPYVASFLILMGANVVANHMLDSVLGKGVGLITKMPFGIGETINDYINVGLVSETVKMAYVYPSVFQALNGILPLKKGIMAKLTRLINMSADEFITLDKIVERKLTFAILLKNIIYYFTNVAVTVAQEDFIRQGVSSDWVGKARELYSNLKTDINDSLNTNIFSIAGISERMYDLFQNASVIFNKAIPMDMDAQSVLAWFKSCLDQLAKHYTGAAPAAPAPAAAAPAPETNTSVLPQPFSTWMNAPVQAAAPPPSYDEAMAQAAATAAQAQAQAKAAADAAAAKIKTDEQVNGMMDKSKDIQKRLNELRKIHAENQVQLAQIAEVQKSLQASMNAADEQGFLTSADKSNLGGDLSHLQGMADGLRDTNASIEESVNIFETILSAKVNLGIFAPNGMKLTRAIADLIKFGKDLQPIEAAAAAARGAMAAEAARIGGVAAAQIADAQRHFETFNILLDTHTKLLNMVAPGTGTGTGLVRDAYDVKQMNAHIAELRGMIQSVETHQQNLQRAEADKQELTAIQANGKNVFCDGKTSCADTATADLAAIETYLNNPAVLGFGQEVLDAAANALLSRGTKTAAPATVPPPPKYPFVMNPALKRYTSVWKGIIDLMTDAERFKVFQQLLQENNLTLSQIATGLIGNGQQPIDQQFASLKKTIDAAYASAQIDRAKLTKLVNHANEQYVAASQATTMLKNRPGATTGGNAGAAGAASNLKNMKQTLLQTNEMLAGLLDARNQLRGTDAQINDILKNLAAGKAVSPDAVPNIASVEGIQEALDQGAQSQGTLDNLLVQGYNNLFFGSPATTKNASAAASAAAAAGEAENTTTGTGTDTGTATATAAAAPPGLKAPSLDDIFAFSRQRTAFMYNSVVKHTHKLDLKIGVEMTPEIRREIENEFNDAMDKFLPKPGDKNYDERFNAMIADTLSTPVKLESDALLIMLQNIKDGLRQYVGDATASMLPGGASLSIVNLLSRVPDAATLGQESGPEQMINYFTQYINDAESSSLGILRAQMLKVQQARLKTEMAADYILSEAGFGPKGSPLLFSNAQVDYVEFIGNMLVSGKIGAIKRMLFDPFTKSQTSIFDNVPVVGGLNKIGNSLIGMSEAITKEALRDENVLHVLFGKDFNYELAAAEWGVFAKAKHWASWASRSFSITNSFFNSYATKKTKDMDLLFEWYNANKSPIWEACKDKSILSNLNFLCSGMPDTLFNPFAPKSI
jgi:hypothetical protein